MKAAPCLYYRFLCIESVPFFVPVGLSTNLIIVGLSTNLIIIEFLIRSHSGTQSNT